MGDQLDGTLDACERLAQLLHHRRDLFARKQAGTPVVQDPDLHRSAYSTVHQSSLEHEEHRGGNRPIDGRALAEPEAQREDPWLSGRVDYPVHEPGGYAIGGVARCKAEDAVAISRGSERVGDEMLWWAATCPGEMLSDVRHLSKGTMWMVFG